MSSANTLVRAWFREPMLWLVLALPAAVVVAGFVTLAIAIRSGGDDAVRDPGSRVGKAQTADLGPERNASRLGLQARLLLASDTEAVELNAEAGVFDSDSLTLAFTHPRDAAADLSLNLVRADASRYVGRLAVSREHAWNLQLEPADGQWRLQGRLPIGTLSADLSPAVDDD
jgi:hypothetical protein